MQRKGFVELLTEVKQGGIDAGYNTFNELISVDGYLSDNITLINRAMEIYAEWVMDKTVEDQKILLDATYTEGIRKGMQPIQS